MTDREEAAALSEADRALCEALDSFVETHTEIVGNIEDAATRIIALSRQLAAAEADAARLAEALGECVEAMEYWAGCDEGIGPEAAFNEIMSAGGPTPALAYDHAKEDLAAHTARLIDG